MKKISQNDLDQWEIKFEKSLNSRLTQSDSAHDLSHFKRVVNCAKKLALSENAQLEIVAPAAWFHDLINLPKNHPQRAQASKLSASEAIKCLNELQYPMIYFDEIEHAIEAHSYSAKISPKSIEAKVLQDADRLDGVGAIGIARCFAVGGKLDRRFYDPQDPFARSRNLDDGLNTLDHFFVKLFKTIDTLQTDAGRKEGLHRAEVMKQYLLEFEREISAI